MGVFPRHAENSPGFIGSSQLSQSVASHTCSQVTVTHQRFVTLLATLVRGAAKPPDCG